MVAGSTFLVFPVDGLLGEVLFEVGFVFLVVEGWPVFQRTTVQAGGGPLIVREFSGALEEFKGFGEWFERRWAWGVVGEGELADAVSGGFVTLSVDAAFGCQILQARVVLKASVEILFLQNSLLRRIIHR